MLIDDTAPGRLVVRDDLGALLDYVYAPTEPQLESPRPYALLHSRGGVDMTAYRPSDHVWHKGLSLALPVVGRHNFWGGPTYVRGEGYVQLANNGAQVHRDFSLSAAPAASDAARLEERLEWIAEDGEAVLGERRTITVLEVDDDAWALTWRSDLDNVSGGPLAFGSPTTKGRENAGYAGIFWRGPVDFTGGEIIGPQGAVGDAARGQAGPWLAFVAPDRSSGILALDASTATEAGGNPWFARSEEYAGLNPAPFFSRETVLAEGDTLTLAAAFVVGGADVARWATTVGADLVAELRGIAQSHPTDSEESA